MPKLLVFAGPNGSGKSTVTSRINLFGKYVNADSIKKYLQCSDLEAAQIAETTREHYLEQSADFTFETVLSTPRNIDLMVRAKQKGYYIVCIYVLTNDPNINIARVHKRVSQGGHTVPDDKVHARYIRALNLLPMLFPICNELYIFDNSLDANEGEPSILIKSINGKIEAYSNQIWDEDMIKSLVSGKYVEDYIQE